jgi:hypothetical protein
MPCSCGWAEASAPTTPAARGCNQLQQLTTLSRRMGHPHSRATTPAVTLSTTPPPAKRKLKLRTQRVTFFTHFSSLELDSEFKPEFSPPASEDRD